MPVMDFFNACWDALQAHSVPYYAAYVEGDRAGQCVNQYQLPYTVDFLVLEEIDYLQTLLDSAQVKEQLNGMIAADQANSGDAMMGWLRSILATLITFSSITTEVGEMWNFDFNTFLSEETFGETSNSPRSVCAGFIWKISAWFPHHTLAGLIDSIKTIFDDTNSSWRHKEAALFMLQQVSEEFDNDSRPTVPGVLSSCIEYTAPTMADCKSDLYLVKKNGLEFALTPDSERTPSCSWAHYYGCDDECLVPRRRC